MTSQMPYNDLIPFNNADFADNPEPRCPCVLILDISGSMQGKPVNELNAGLVDFRDQLLSDSLASKRVEIAIVTFGDNVDVVNDFQLATAFSPVTLNASGSTPMGQAITKGLDLLNTRKKTYKDNGISYYRPWVFLITDGGPTDYWQDAARLVKEGENNQAFAFFAVGVDGANMNILSQISVREPLKLAGLNFRSLFQWLSNSMRAVSRSAVGAKLALESPSGWAEV